MNRVFWIDSIRVISALFVIAIHVCGRVAGGYAVDNSGDLSETLGYMVAQCIQYTCSSVCIPLFIMVSGALLLGRNEEVIPFYRKRFGKILLPFVGWSCIFSLCIWLGGGGLKGGTPVTLINSIGAFISGHISGHFWFMYMLIALYLVAPFLSVFVRNASKNMQTCFLVLWIFATALFPVINRIATETLGITEIYFCSFQFDFVALWIGFFIAGFILKDYVIPKWLAMLGIVLLLGCSMALPVSLYVQKVCPESSMIFFVSFMSKYVLAIISHKVTLSLIAFFTLRSLGDLPALASSYYGRVVVATAPLTFGIYLCHHLILVPVMGIFDQLFGLGSCESGLIVLFAVPALSIFFYFVAAGVIYVIRLNRYLQALLAP